MKKNFLLRSSIAICALLLSITTINAQSIGKLYGLFSRAGDSAGGVEFSYDPLNGNDTVIKNFYNGIISPYYNNLVQATDGDFYGMTTTGGANNSGVIFKCTSAGVVTLLHNFTGYPDGYEPFGTLIQATDGNLYGMAYGGGTNGYGIIFKCSTTGTYSIIYSFNSGLGGCQPYGSLVQAKDGNLYGMTSTGGANNDGVVFSCTLGGTYAKIADFDGTNGSNPQGNLMQANDGNLYGMTYAGGANNVGTLFQCTTSGTIAKLVDFVGAANGSNPYGGLVQGKDSLLYGMTQNGGANGQGVLFNCSIAGVYTKLVDFNYYTTGGAPYGNLIQGADSNLYGMTSQGGSGYYGTVFKCTTKGTVTTLVNFSNYEAPYGSLIQATDGNLYGMTTSGGAAIAGTIFKCTTTGSKTVLYNMGVSTFGSNPNGSMTQGRDGSLYGMTEQGGALGYGTIFKTDQAGVTTVVFNFDSTNGASTYGSLIMANDGFLYGMTNRGGAFNGGVIFKCSTTGVMTKLVDFNITNGIAPFGHLIQGADSNLYGMTENGGPADDGVIFQCTRAGVFTVLYNFAGSNDGQYPYGSLIQANDGNLYGVTESGGTSNAGVIFQCTTTGTYTKLYSFNGGTDGANPQGSLIQATDGNLYGITYSSGANGLGTIFSCSTTGTFTKLADLTNATGGNTYGSFIQATDSNLYALMQNGGNYNDGTILKYTLKGVVSAPYNFDGTKGYAPEYSDLLEVMSTSIGTKTTGCVARTLIANVRGGGIGTYTYSWSTGATTSSISALNTAADYTVTVTNPNGVTISSTISLPVYTPLSASVSAVAPKCFGSADGSIVVNGMDGIPGYSYMWNGGLTTSSISGLTAATYTATITDMGGCTVNDTIKLTNPPALVANITSQGSPSCFGNDNGFANVTAGGGTGAYSYLWNDASSTVTSGITGLGAGKFIVTVTDGNGCTDTTSVTFTMPSPIQLGISYENPVCHNGSNGFVIVAAGGGTPGYVYNWSNGSTSSSITNVTAGDYTVVVTDAYSCTDTATVIIVNPAVVSVTTAAVTNATCNTCTDGSATVTITGGNKNVIVWEDSTATGYAVLANHTADTINKITADTYVCMVTDSCGDSKTDTIRVKGTAVGIQSISDNDGVSVYPVPASNNLSFVMNGGGYQLLTIYDETGHEVYKQMLDEQNANSTLNLNTSVYANGLYFAQIITAHGVLNKKIVIQR